MRPQCTMAENDSYQMTKNFHIYLTETRISLDTAAKGKFYCCFDAWLRYYQQRDTLTESVIDGLSLQVLCNITRPQPNPAQAKEHISRI